MVALRKTSLEYAWFVSVVFLVKSTTSNSSRYSLKKYSMIFHETYAVPDAGRPKNPEANQPMVILFFGGRLDVTWTH
jgi:hypothetical protein